MQYSSRLDPHNSRTRILFIFAVDIFFFLIFRLNSRVEVVYILKEKNNFTTDKGSLWETVTRLSALRIECIIYYLWFNSSAVYIFSAEALHIQAVLLNLHNIYNYIVTNGVKLNKQFVFDENSLYSKWLQPEQAIINVNVRFMSLSYRVYWYLLFLLISCWIDI